MSTARQPQMMSVLRLPAPLYALVERQIARQQELNDQLAVLESKLNGNEPSPEWQARWKGTVAELAGINDLLELLQMPIVRFVARDQDLARRQRREQISRSAQVAQNREAARLN